MTFEISWYCDGCRDANKHSHGGKQDREETYTVFSEIVQHIIENPEHYVEMRLRDASEDEN
jgi:hypothetical protein